MLFIAVVVQTIMFPVTQSKFKTQFEGRFGVKSLKRFSPVILSMDPPQIATQGISPGGIPDGSYKHYIKNLVKFILRK